MPIKSKAQRRKFAQLLIQGDITPETYEEWNRGAGNKELPERLHPKAKAKRTKTKSKRKRKVSSKRNSTSRVTRPKRRQLTKA